MSSLAGALDDYPQSYLPKRETTAAQSSDDVEMNSSPHRHGHASEQEEDEGENQDEEMSDLFGNDNDVEEQRHARAAPASPTTSGPDSERLPSPDRERRHALEYEEEDVPPEIAVEVKEAEVRFPNLPVPKSSDGDNWVFRVPNYVKVDTKPFHPDTYIGPEHDEEEFQGDSGREKTMTIKLKVENMIRWRWTKDANGQDKRESNARVIRWSDGSLSLRLGKELFDINQSIDTSAAVPRQTLGGAISQSQSQSQTPLPPATPGKSQGLTYLVAQHKRSQVLQSEAVITGYMSLRPTGMQSEIHRMLVKAVEQKHNKIAKLRMAPDPQIDPEREKMELLKQSAKKTKKKTDEDGLGGGRKRRNYRRTMDHDVLWSDDEDERGGMYAGGSDEDDDESMASPRKMKRKSGEAKGEEDYQADDFVVADSDDDAEGAGPSRKRARETSEADDLERMEASLEKQAAAERRHRGSDPKKAKKKADVDEDTEGDDAMDVESEEEEEEEFKVRRVTSKRAIAVDDEDDE
ncbi:hypothetical protein GALMADRAFT_240881 [Galerina marginata CBS 339.88]|uniref:Leo1-like protein n=1 Tax=Galerina marginata (strain CBS 339.88) TaxID=685588 RepID=A0A067TNN0_GALM3|nr:hypothetical protein GALMADRAFT_240881 [Galerina marginata CBS 339.88]